MNSKTITIQQNYTPTYSSNYAGNRDKTFDILKGIGIILMVIGHAGCPKLMREYIYTFHMPLFFIASGYFFSAQNINKKRDFLIRRLKSIYLPFWICSVIFLLLHNTFFHLGIINSDYGLGPNIGSYEYSYSEITRRFFQISLTMGGYEPFLLGAYWFMGALMTASILMCYGTYILNLVIKSINISTLVLALGSLLMVGIIFSSPQLNCLPHRVKTVLLGIFFMVVGFYLKNVINIQTISSLRLLEFAIPVSIVTFLIFPASMDYGFSLKDCLFLSIEGVAGTLIIYVFSKWLSRKQAGKVLSYFGKKSLWILSLHMLIFKLSGLIEISIYDLPPSMIGYHPVIPHEGSIYWIVHTCMALAISLIIAYLYNNALSFIKKR